MDEDPSARGPVPAAEAYNRYAPRYDDLLQENRINHYMRQRMVSVHPSAFPPGGHLVELGCGTGDEALALADSGFRVTALDPASRMIEIARAKAAERGLGARVTFHPGRARDVARIVATEEGGPLFDGGLSSFALSYEPDLSEVAKALGQVLRPQAPLVISTMNRLCASEGLLAFVSGRWGLAGRRLRSATRHKVGQVYTTIYPRTPAEVRRAFHPAFELQHIRALPVLLPPHYANRALQRWPLLLEGARHLDRRWADAPLLRQLGDHTVFWFRRRPTHG